MVVAHAAIAAETGVDVIVLIDDGGGRRLADVEARRLDRLRGTGAPVGRIRAITTLTVLQSAAGTEHLPDKTALRDVYTRLRSLDDGLPPIGETGLLNLGCWA